MRLSILTRRNKWWIRAGMEGLRMPIGPIAICRYRPAFFGRDYGMLLRSTLEKPRYWSRGEMELFAAFISKCNHCLF